MSEIFPSQKKQKIPAHPVAGPDTFRSGSTPLYYLLELSQVARIYSWNVEKIGIEVYFYHVKNFPFYFFIRCTELIFFIAGPDQTFQLIKERVYKKNIFWYSASREKDISRIPSEFLSPNQECRGK